MRGTPFPNRERGRTTVPGEWKLKPGERETVDRGDGSRAVLRSSEFSAGQGGAHAGTPRHYTAKEAHARGFLPGTGPRAASHSPPRPPILTALKARHPRPSLPAKG